MDDGDGQADSTLEVDGEYAYLTVEPDGQGGTNLSVSATPTDLTLMGTPQEDTLVGGDGNDTISALESDDLVSGGAGDDSIDAGDGNDTVYGGDGADSVEAGAGDDVIHGDGAAETPAVTSIDINNYDATDSGFGIVARRIENGEHGEWSADHITEGYGGIGVDGDYGGIPVQLGHDPVSGLSEELAVTFEVPVDSAEVEVLRLFSGEGSGGEQGHWAVFSGDQLVGEGDFQAPSGHETTVTIDTEAPFDRIVFSATPYGDGPNGSNDSSDYIIRKIDATHVAAGDDLLYGGAGDDTLDGGAGADTAYGGEGADVVAGGAGSDLLYGDDGVAAAEPQFGPELIVNGDFEDLPGDLNHGSWGVFTSISGWTAEDLTPGEGGVAPIEIQSGLHGGVPTFPEGTDSDNNFVELDSSAELGGTSGDTNVLLAQTVDVPEGGTFQFGFDYAARSNGDTSEMTVWVDGVPVLEITDGETEWGRRELELELDAGPHVIAFSGADADGTSDTYGALLDNVSLRQIMPLGEDDTLKGGAGDDTLYGGGGNDVFEGTVADLNGDTLADYEAGEAVRVLGADIGEDAVTVTVANGETTVSVDADGDGVAEATFTLTGEFELDEASSDGSATALTFRAPVDGLLLEGTDGADTLIGDLGDDTLIGKDGDDVLSGGRGADEITGGAGADTVLGTAQELNGDTIAGLDDDDVVRIDGVVLDTDDVTLTAADGNTTVALDTNGDGEADSTFVVEGEFLDVDITADGDGTELSRAENEPFTVTLSSDFTPPATPEDGYVLTGGSESESGTLAGSDIGHGSSGDAEVSYAFDGEGGASVSLDSAWNSVKNVRVENEGAGDVTLSNFVHTDVFLGDGGDSTVDIDGTKRGKIVTGDGDDTIDIDGQSNGGSDTINVVSVSSGEGADAITVSGYQDNTIIEIEAGEGADEVLLDGDHKSATVDLGGGADSAVGGNAAETLVGAAGEDTIFGGAGGDRIVGGSGIDSLAGGEGDDIFAGSADDHDGDVITDFEAGDRLRFEGTTFGADDVVLSIVDGDTLVEVDSDGDEVVDATVRLQGVFGQVVVSFEGGATDLSFGTRITDQLIIGTEDTDSLTGGAGNDTVSALGGDDLLSGGLGQDLLTGGEGVDTFIGTAEELDGDQIADFTAGESVQVVGSTLVADDISLETVDDQTTVRIDTDGDGAADSTFLLQGTFDDVVVNFDAGASTLSFGTQVADQLIVGTEGADVLVGDRGNDTISGDAGDDEIYGGAGDDILYGGEGDDTFGGTLEDLDGDRIEDLEDEEIIFIDGMTLDEGDVNVETVANFTILEIDEDGDGEVDATIVLDGEFEIDEVETANGGTRIVVDNGVVDMDISGTNQDDFLVGGAGNDTIESMNGRDTVLGMGGDDLLIGENGDDTLDGGSGDDVLIGERGHDVLRGGEGNDTVYGGLGHDSVDGGLGEDVLVGGKGSDTFGGSAANLDGDRIEDFQLGERIKIEGIGLGEDDISVTTSNGVTTVAVDVDGDGEVDSTFTLDGTVEKTAVVQAIDGGTEISFTGGVDGTYDSETSLVFQSADGGVFYFNGVDSSDVMDLGEMEGTTLIATGDMNGDGNDDLVWKRADGGVFMQEGGSPTETVELGNHANDELIAATDLDGSGGIDLLWRNQAGQVFSVNDGVTSDTTYIGDYGGFTFVSAADLDGNGIADQLWQGDYGITWALMDGSPSNWNYLGMHNDAEVLAVTDIDGQGGSDVILRDTNDGSVFTIDNAVRNESTNLGNAQGETLVAVADVNGNGVDDLIWQDAQGAVRAQTDGGIGSTSLGDLSGHELLAVADVDGTGGDDLVWRGPAGRTFVMHDGSAIDTTELGDRSGDTLAAVSDVDGSGGDDLVWIEADNDVSVVRDGSVSDTVVFGSLGDVDLLNPDDPDPLAGDWTRSLLI